MQKRSSLKSGVVAAAMAAMVGTAQAAVIFSDSFDRTSGNADTNNPPTLSDWGANDNALGGSVVQTYAVTPTRTGGSLGIDQTVQEADTDGNNEGVIRYGATATTYDLATDVDVLAAGGYIIEVDVTRGPSGFAGITIGHDPSVVATQDGGAAFGPVNNGDVTILIQDNGGAGRVQYNPGGINFDGIAGFPDSSAEVPVKITVAAPDGFDAGDIATITVEVGGSWITTQNATLDGTFAGHVSFEANTGGAIYDNLVISTIPEPASLALFGLGGLAMLRRRA